MIWCSVDGYWTPIWHLEALREAWQIKLTASVKGHPDCEGVISGKTYREKVGDSTAGLHRWVGGAGRGVERTVC